METLPREVWHVTQYDLDPFKRGRKVGYYLLGKVVGEGSFAKVREGVHILTGEKVAVKIIDKKRAREDRYISKNLRREAKILQLIRHPHIIQLLEVLETDNFYYLVMEFCGGGELLDYICTRKRLEEDSAKRLVGQLVSAVDQMHKEGIVHRDLKIENFLLNENYDLKIIDFGLSNTMPAECIESFKKTGIFTQMLNTHCGSPAYAAPELLAQKNYGPQVDVWSIGINMYAMLTGFLPYMMEPFNVMEMYEKMMQRKMTPIPGFLSKECRDLLLRLLEPVPEWRITLKQVKKHKWFGSNEPVPRTLSLGDIMYAKRELCESVLNYMKHNLKIKTKDAVTAVVSNKALHASAVYHLLVKRLDRYLQESKRNECTSFSKLEIIKKATLQSPKKIPPINDKLESSSNGKMRRFTFRGRKINAVSKSQPILIPYGEEVPKTKITKVANETRSLPDNITLPIKIVKPKIIKKEKVTRTLSDKTHLRKKDIMRNKGNVPNPISYNDNTTSDVEKRNKHQHRRLKRSASSDNEEDVRNSIRNSLICDSDQDLFKPIAQPCGDSSIDPGNDDSFVSERKLSFDEVPIDTHERRTLSVDSSMEKTITSAKEIEKLNSPLVKRRGSLLDYDSMENKIRETKEACPGWLITKIVKQPPLKPEQPPFKSENVRDEENQFSFCKSEDKTFLQTNDNRFNDRDVKSRSNSSIQSKSSREDSMSYKKSDSPMDVCREKYVSTGNLTSEKNNEGCMIQQPLHRKMSEAKFQHAWCKTMTYGNRAELMDTTMRRTNTSDSIKTFTDPPSSFSPPRRRMSGDDVNKKVQNMESVSALLEMKARAYNKIMSPIKQTNLSKDPRLPTTDDSFETTPELQNILSNIEYINRHHLNINSTSNKNEKPNGAGMSAVTYVSSSNNRGSDVDSSSDSYWNGVHDSMSANRVNDKYKKSENELKSCMNHKLSDKTWANTNDKTGISSTEEYRKTVKNVSNSYTHERVWKPPERMNTSDPSKTIPTNYPKVIWRAETVDTTSPTDSLQTRTSTKIDTESACVDSNHLGDNLMPYKNMKLDRPASTPPETFLNTDFSTSLTKAKSKNEINCDDMNDDLKSEITPKVVVRQRIAKLESFKKDYTLQSPRVDSKISSSINKITPSKKVVELNVRELSLFKKQSMSTSFNQRTRSIDELNNDAPPKLSPTLKPLEISFDFAQMKKRASMLKNQAKSMPNVYDLDEECCTQDIENSSTKHEYNYHEKTNRANKSGYNSPNDMGLMLSQKYHSSLSLSTAESMV